MSNAIRYTALGLAGGATVLLILVQFVPIERESSSFDAGGFGDFDFTFNANLWNAKTEAGGEEDTHGWFEECDGSGDDCDGLGLIRTGAIVLTVGLAAAAVAAALFAFGPARAASIAAFCAGGLALAGFLFWTIGYGQFADGEMADLTDAAAGFVLAIVAITLLVAAGVLGLFVRGAPTPAARRSGQLNF